MYLKYSFTVYYLIITIVVCKHIDKLHVIELFTTYNGCSNNAVANNKECTHLNSVIGSWYIHLKQMIFDIPTTERQHGIQVYIAS